ncbi:hypothetical protein ES705_35393 [subsurface metagenome]
MELNRKRAGNNIERQQAEEGNHHSYLKTSGEFDADYVNQGKKQAAGYSHKFYLHLGKTWIKQQYKYTYP